jgi:hypothetical protein
MVALIVWLDPVRTCFCFCGICFFKIDPSLPDGPKLQENSASLGGVTENAL